jgi:hypothetical protein
VAASALLGDRSSQKGGDLISGSLPFGRLLYAEPNAISNAIDYAKFRSRSHRAVIHVYDETGNVIENARARERFQRGLAVVRTNGKRFIITADEKLTAFLELEIVPHARQ